MIGTNAGPSPIAGEKCSPYQFVVSRQGDQQAEVLGKYATQKGYRRVMLLAPNYQAGKDVLAGFRRYFKNEVVDEIYTPWTSSIFRRNWPASRHRNRMPCSRSIPAARA